MPDRNPDLATVLQSPTNSFNLVRLVAAAGVVITHSFLLFGGPEAEPLSWGPFDLGANAVNVFFVLSGLMLSRSFELRPDWRAFAAARVLRIFPALIVSGAVVAWIIAPLTTVVPLAGYYLDPETLFYPILSSILFENAHLPGVFLASTQPGAVDLPLWTVKYELLAYVVFGVASALGLLRLDLVVLTLTIAFGSTLVLIEQLPADPSPLFSVVRFGFCFLVGVSLFRFRAQMRVVPWAAPFIVLGAAPLGLTALGPIAWVLALAYAALCLAAIEVPIASTATRRWDISFGLYIYAFPVQQALFGAGPLGADILPHVIVSALVAGLLAIASWHLVERPALALKSVLRPRTPPRPAGSGPAISPVREPGG